jgi:hypothetical protein
MKKELVKTKTAGSFQMDLPCHLVAISTMDKIILEI